MDVPEIVKEKNPPAPDGLGPMWCGGCAAYKGNTQMGGCRGREPTPFIVGIGQDMLGRQQPIINSYWPSVGTSDWCAQFRRAPHGRVLEEPPAQKAPGRPAKKDSGIIMPDEVSGSA